MNKSQGKAKNITDRELIKLVEKEIDELALTGGKSHKMSVPPRFRDTDILLNELLSRFKLSEEATPHKLTDY